MMPCPFPPPPCEAFFIMSRLGKLKCLLREENLTIFGQLQKNLQAKTNWIQKNFEEKKFFFRFVFRFVSNFFLGGEILFPRGHVCHSSVGSISFVQLSNNVGMPLKLTSVAKIWNSGPELVSMGYVRCPWGQSYK